MPDPDFSTHENSEPAVPNGRFVLLSRFENVYNFTVKPIVIPQWRGFTPGGYRARHTDRRVLN